MERLSKFKVRPCAYTVILLIDMTCSRPSGYEGRAAAWRKVQRQVPDPEHTHHAREGDSATSRHRMYFSRDSLSYNLPCTVVER